MRDRRKREGLNFGDVLHILTILGMILTVGMGYQQALDIKAEVTGHNERFDRLDKRFDRVEHYLAGKDQHYYDKVDK